MCQTIAEEATPKDSHGREGSPSCARMDKATQRVPPYPTGRSGDYNLVHAETNLAAGTGGLPALDRATGGCAIRRSQSSQVYAAGRVCPAQRGAHARRQELEQPAPSGDSGAVRDGSLRQESGKSGEAQLRSEGCGKGRAGRQGGSQGGDGILRRNPRGAEDGPADLSAGGREKGRAGVPGAEFLWHSRGGERRQGSARDTVGAGGESCLLYTSE